MPRKRRARALPEPKWGVSCTECVDSDCLLVDGYQWICSRCGLCQDGYPEDSGGPADYERCCIVKRSHHDPVLYFLKLLKQWDIEADIHSTLAQRFKSVKDAAIRTRPGHKSNLPNYPFVTHKLCLEINRPDQTARIKLPSGKKVLRSLDTWFQLIQSYRHAFREVGTARCNPTRSQRAQILLQQKGQWQIPKPIIRKQPYRGVRYRSHQSTVRGIKG